MAASNTPAPYHIYRCQQGNGTLVVALYYHGQLSWVARSCGLPYSQREIRYCAREYCSRPSQMLHQVTYDVVATLIRPNKMFEP
eukprot:scaffold15267_cov98-Skeletonema_dohrnii-CCMP3373.AAC.1